MTGPRVLVVPERRWKKQLAADNVRVSYPIGAYIITDDDGVPDQDDRVRVRADLWIIALKHMRETQDKLTGSERRALGLLFHELSHAKVPSLTAHTTLHGGTVATYKALEARYSHPSSKAGLVAQIRHAFRCGFGINAFTRWLRWSYAQPVGLWQEGLWWLEFLIDNPGHVEALEA